MSSKLKKIQKNAKDFAIQKYYENMTPQMYQEGIRNAIKITEERMNDAFHKDSIRMVEDFNKRLQECALFSMDTLATEMIYELGRLLECYVDEPENLEQKIDVVQGIYETAIHAIEDYGSDKYKNDKEAQKEFERKKKVIFDVFDLRESDIINEI